MANFTLILRVNPDVPEDLQLSKFHQSALHSDHFHHFPSIMSLFILVRSLRLAFFFWSFLFEERERLIEEAERALRQKRKQVMLDSRLNEYQAALLMSAHV